VSDAWLQQIRSHVERHIGPVDREFPGDRDAQSADVLHVSPVDSRPYHTLVTAGMSSVPMHVPPEVNAPHRLELMMTLREGWKPLDDWPVRLLQHLSRTAHEHERWLGWGHIVRNGSPAQPLAPHTDLCGVIIAPSLLVPVAFYELSVDGERVAFYSVIPLYEEELQLHAREGMAALLERLLQNDINDVVNLKRKNVARKKLFGLF
jgi:hypothetical protein